VGITSQHQGSGQGESFFDENLVAYPGIDVIEILYALFGHEGPDFLVIGGIFLVGGGNAVIQHDYRLVGNHHLFHSQGTECLDDGGGIVVGEYPVGPGHHYFGGFHTFPSRGSGEDFLR